MMLKKILIGCSILVFTTLSYILGWLFPFIGGSIIALTGGLLINLLCPAYSRTAREQLKLVGSKGLKLAIILMGFGLSLPLALKVGKESLSLMLITISVTLILGLSLGKLFKIGKDQSALIACGTSICGGSAIASLAPVIKAKDDDITLSLAIIFLYNFLAALIFPVVGHFFDMSQSQFALFAGTAINDTSSVVAASSVYGDEALELAIIVKLTRTLFIIPITLGFALFYRRKDRNAQLSLTHIIPVFIILFVLASVVNSFGLLPSAVTLFLSKAGKLVMLAALFSISAQSNITAIKNHGAKLAMIGGILWLVITGITLFVILH